MKSKFLKTIATLTTGVAMASYLGPLSANAKMMTNVVPGSQLRYDVSTSTIKDNSGRPRVCVTITGESSNPDFEELSIAVQNSENCTFKKMIRNYEYVNDDDSETLETYIGPEDGNNLAVSRFQSFKSASCTGAFKLKLYYEPDSIEEINTYQFKIGVFTYKSRQESISDYTTTNAPDAIVSSNQNASLTGVQYRLGDIDNSGKIELTDAYDTLTIANSFASEYVSNSMLNHYLVSNTTWREKYPNLVCAEVADVNDNGRVEKNDAELILQYNSQCMAGLTPENDAIGKVIFTEIDF